MKHNILIVDDDINLLHSYERKLRNKYNVVTSTSGNTALKIIKDLDKLNLIISDFQMPGLNGVQFLSKAKTIVPDASRILITGHANLDIVINSINEGNIFRFLTKPFTDDVFYLAIEEALHYNKLQKIEASDKLKNDFLLLISHEIRTPVSNISNYLQLIEEELKDSSNSDIISCLESVSNSSNRFLRTIDLIVNTAEAISGNYIPHFENIDVLASVIAPLNEIYYEKAKRKNLAYKFITDLENCFNNVDMNSISVTISQIIENAINFTTQGFVEIKLYRDPNSTFLEITDTGEGISEDYLQNIFTPFAQESTGYTRKYDGNGLGLTLAKHYADLNNVKLSITSKKNFGTTCMMIFNN